MSRIKVLGIAVCSLFVCVLVGIGVFVTQTGISDNIDSEAPVASIVENTQDYFKAQEAVNNPDYMPSTPEEVKTFPYFRSEKDQAYISNAFKVLNKEAQKTNEQSNNFQNSFTPNSDEAYATYDANSKVLTLYYDDEKAKKTLPTYSINIKSDTPGAPSYYEHNTEMEKVVITEGFKNCAPKSMFAWFGTTTEEGYIRESHLNTIEGFENLNFTNCIDMSFMFTGCQQLHNLNFNIPKPQTKTEGVFKNVMGTIATFAYCGLADDDNNKILSTLTSHFSDNLVDVSFMFDGNQTTFIDFQEEVLNHATSLSSVFLNCSKLRDINNLSSFSSKSDVFASMFEGCSQLKVQDGNLDVNKLVKNRTSTTNTANMFKYCRSLQTIDLSNSSFMNPEYCFGMFEGCPVNTIKVGSGWSSKVTFDKVSLGGIWESNGVEKEATELPNGAGVYQRTGYDLSGIVTTIDRQPLQDVLVTCNISENNAKTVYKTGADGKYCFRLPRNTKGTLSFIKDGFLSKNSEEFVLAKNINNVEPLVLERYDFAISDLRTDGEINPNALSNSKPVFTWKMDCKAVGQQQSAYQVQVWHGDVEMWDSGKVASKDFSATYNGKALETGQTYTWKVTVYDKDDNAVESSEASFGIAPKAEDIFSGAQYLSSREGSEADIYGENPIFRTKFSVDKEVKSATLYSTGLGVYNSYINGKRVGIKDGENIIYDELLPGFTERDKRQYYTTQDVKWMLQEGDNALSAIVTSGFWNGSVAREDGNRVKAYKAVLKVDYEDGSTFIKTNTDDWKTSSDSPIKSAGIFQGEKYDARTSLAWMNADFDDSSWANPKVNEQFKGTLDPWLGTHARIRTDLQRNPQGTIKVFDPSNPIGAGQGMHGKINVQKTYQPGEEIHIPAGQTAIIDFGQNAAGWEKFSVKGSTGTTVTVKHGEMLNDNNGETSRGNSGQAGSMFNSNRGASAQTDYIIGSNNYETYSPSFTYYGFRYIEIYATSEITVKDISAQTVTSAGNDTGHITTENTKVNQVISNSRWSMYSNYLNVPTDCPQRDERQGWMGDTQVYAETGNLLSNSKTFLEKFCVDMMDSQSDDAEAAKYPDIHQHAKGAYSSTAPQGCYLGGGGGSAEHNNWGATGWGDCGIILPYTLYAMHNDKDVINRNWNSMVAYMDFIENYSKNYNNNDGPCNCWGDWLAFESNNYTGPVLGRSYYATNALMMAKMAEAVGKPAETVKKYYDLYDSIKKQFKDDLLDKHYNELTTQTECAYILYAGLYDNDTQKEEFTSRLVNNIRNNGNKLSTGFMGTKVLLDALSMTGHNDVAYDLLLQEAFPSWIYPVNQGATTVWERWNSYTIQSGFETSGMNSFNHYAYGAVVAWMYHTMLGIQYDATDNNTVGYKNIILNPYPDERFARVSGDYDSNAGMIKVSSDFNKTVKWDYAFDIPAGATSTLTIPKMGFSSYYINGKALGKCSLAEDGVHLESSEGDNLVINTTSGHFEYKASYEPAQVVLVTTEGYGYDKGTLVFINDNEDYSSLGKVYKLIPGQGVPWKKEMSQIKYVCFDESFATYEHVYSMDDWFNGATNLISFDGRFFDRAENVSSSNNLFKGCINLGSGSNGALTFPKGLKVLGDSAFEGCSSLSNEKFSLPDTIRSIGRDAFKGTMYIDDPQYEGDFIVDYSHHHIIGTKTSEVSRLEISDNFYCAATDAFSNMPQLKRVFVKNNTFGVSNEAFKGCSNLTTFIVEAQNENDKSVYSGQPFAGAIDPLNHAPIAVVGGNGARSANVGNYAKIYSYCPVDSISGDLGGNNYYLLQKDVDTSGRLVIGNSDDNNIAIDLNGHKIDRHLSQATNYGYVMVLHNQFSVNLRVDDSSAEENGVITGGWTDTHAAPQSVENKGGAINASPSAAGKTSSIDFIAGNLKGNHAQMGGAISIDDSSNGKRTLNMYGGNISENDSYNDGEPGGGAVYVGKGSVMNMFGGTIQNNTKGSVKQDVYVENEGVYDVGTVNLYGGNLGIAYLRYLNGAPKFYPAVGTNYTLVNGINGTAEYEFDSATKTAKVAGHTDTDKDYVVNIPTTVGPYSVTEIKAGAFADDEHLRKVALDNATITVNDAFTNCSKLDTFVVKADGTSDKVVYNTPKFGSENVIFAGGNNTKTFGGDTFYQYTALNGGNVSNTIELKNDLYYQLTGNLNANSLSGALLKITTKNAVFDLNGFNVNRNLAKETGDGVAIAVVPDNDNIKLRLDDTTTADLNNGGQITGGYGAPSDLAYYGSGISLGHAGKAVDVTLDMFGGRVTGNKSNIEGAGIDVRAYMNGKEHHTTLNMHGGSIDGNSIPNDVTYGGAGIKMMYNTIFNMYGGRVNSNNVTANSHGAGIFMEAGDVAKNDPATLTMYGGTVLDNKIGDTQGGIFRNGAIFKASGVSRDKFVLEDELFYDATVDLNGGELPTVPQGWNKNDDGTYTKPFGYGTDYSVIFNELTNAGLHKTGSHIDSWDPATGTLEDNTNFTVNWTSSSSIIGHAKNEQGAPVANATVDYLVDGKVLSTTTTGADGNFKLTGTDSTKGHVEIKAQGYVVAKSGELTVKDTEVNAGEFILRQSNFTVGNLQVDGKTDPIGTDSKTPTFTWNFTSDVHGEAQAQYKIVVKDFQNNPVWDSGWIDSTECRAVYAGNALESSSDYTWIVSAKDEGGAEKTSPTAKFQTALLDGFTQGKFISMSGAGTNPVVFRKDIDATANITSAKLYTAGLGNYQVYIDGDRVYNEGDPYYELDACYTEPLKHQYYTTYDVTHMLKNKSSLTMSALVTSGWWSGNATSEPRGTHNGFRAYLILETSDGTKTFTTDTTWKASTQASPVKLGDIYHGETYDFRVDTSWKLPNYEAPADVQWQDAIVNPDNYSGKLSPWIGPHVVVRDDLVRENKNYFVYDGAKNVSPGCYGVINEVTRGDTVQDLALNSGHKLVIDCGQNAAGWEDLEISGPAGSQVTIRHSEMLNDHNGEESRRNDGPGGSPYYANLRSAKATTTLYLNGERQSYHTGFSFYGFRYIEIWADANVTVHKCNASTITSVNKDAGTIHTSDDNINQLISNSKWGMYSNYLSVPTDCPQRDERMGWLGDAEIYSETGCFFGDSKDFLRKYCEDMKDVQNFKNVQGAMPGIAPLGNSGGQTPNATGWADAAIIIPYTLYSMYGDTTLLSQNWDLMKNYLASFPNCRNDGWGDWLAPADSHGGQRNSEPVKNALTKIFNVWDYKMMIEMATALNKQEDVTTYTNLYNSAVSICRDTCFNGESLKGELQNSQSVCLYLLYLDLCPSQTAITNVTNILISDISASGESLGTGFLGTKVLLDSLTKIGRADIAYKLLNSHNFPSWLYSVDQGATTIWERWDSYRTDTGFHPEGMNSFNHYAYGSVVAWMFHTMAGINSDINGAGFKNVIISPRPDKSIETVEAEYPSVNGTIGVKSEINDGGWKYNFSIPANMTATVKLPAMDYEKFKINGKNIRELNLSADGIQFDKYDDKEKLFYLTAQNGTYNVEFAYGTAQAVLNNNVLTFYNDDDQHEGTTYTITDGSKVEWDKAQIHEVNFDESMNEYPYIATTANWFSGATALTKFDGTNFVSSRVHNSADMFKGCVQLNDVTLPSDLKVVGDNFYNGCTQLASVTIPESVTSVGANVITGTKYSQNPKIVDEAIFDASGKYLFTTIANPTITRVDLKSDIRCVASEAFVNAKALKYVVVNNPNIGIGSKAFSGTDLTTYVVCAEDANDKVIYNGNPFMGLGGTTNHAPLAIAGGNSTNSLNIERGIKYNFKLLEATSADQYFSTPNTYYYLNNNILLPGRLIVDAQNVAFDLNGFTMNRNCTEKTNCGYSIVTNCVKNCSLRIDDSKDGTGKITGGWTDETASPSEYTGGAINLSPANTGTNVFSTLDFVNGTITGNKACKGGALAACDSSNGKRTINIYGGTITGNEGYGNVGGAIYVGPGSDLNMYAGNIEGNTAEHGKDIYVDSQGHGRTGSFNLLGGNAGSIYLDGDSSSHFYPSKDAQYTLEPDVAPVSLIYNFNNSNMTASVVGHTEAKSDYAIYVPKNVNKYTVTDIAANVFANDTHLRKVVIDSPTLNITAGAFNGCANIDTFVVKATGDNDKVVYGANTFGSDKIIYAGGTSTQKYATNKKFYVYTPVSYGGGKVVLNENNYYQLTNDVIAASDFAGELVDVTATNCVLDLNACDINRNRAVVASDAVCLWVTSANNDVTLRLDDTSTCSMDHGGRITGAYNQSYGNEIYGSGVSLGHAGRAYNVTMNMFGGRITGNHDTVEGAGIDMRAYATTNECHTTLNIYGGSIDNNFVHQSTAQSNKYGGAGIKMMYNTILNMYAGRIDSNTVENNLFGAGVYMEKNDTYDSAVFNMHGGSVLNNKIGAGIGGIKKNGATFNPYVDEKFYVLED